MQPRFRQLLAAVQGLRLDTRDYPDPQAIVHAYLRGRRVAVTPSTLGPFVLSRALEEACMAYKDVQVVPIAAQGGCGGVLSTI